MARSTGISRKRGLHGLSSIIRARSRAVTVERVSESTGSLDEVSTTTTQHTESLWLFEPRENVASEVVGERLNGSLGALAVSDGSVDIQLNDRVTHGGVEYEVDTIVGHPEDDTADGTNSPETDFWLINFMRRQ